VSPLLSVIICAHNPRRDHLHRALAALEAQTLPRADWELLLVDNASREPLASTVDLGWHPAARHVQEPQPGLVHARLRGIDAARGEILVFVDDDNVLAPDYLAQVVAIAREHGHLGAWGGRIAAEFEVPPAGWMTPYLPLLALRDFERDSWSNRIDALDSVPCGAGLCIRRAIAQRYAANVRTSPLRQTLGRTGGSLASGEDTDMALTACDAGLGTGVFTRLRLTHLIARERVEPAYLERLAEGIMRSYVLVMSLRTPQQRAQPSRAERLFRAYRAWRLPRSVRRMEAALERGRRAAYDQLQLP
jgi:hypothetical protein